MRKVYMWAQISTLSCLLFSAPQTLADVNDEAYPHLVDVSSGEDVVEVKDIPFSAEDHEELIAQQGGAFQSTPSNKGEKRALKSKHKAEIRALNIRFQDDLRRLEMRHEAAIKALEAGR